jgi:hypothetical protein
MVSNMMNPRMPLKMTVVTMAWGSTREASLTSCAELVDYESIGNIMVSYLSHMGCGIRSNE